MTLSQSKQYLKSNKFFLNHGQKRSSANAIIQTILDILSHQENSFVGHL